MRNHLKAAAGAAVAVLSLASVTAFAQPASGQQPQPDRQMNQQMMQDGQGMRDGNMTMMQDSNMGQMMQMMRECEKMMQEAQAGSTTA